MPVHVVEKLNKIVRTERKLRAEYGREPQSWEIARELDLSIKTVGNHRTRILEKLGAANTAEAIGLAYKLGLIKEPSRQ
jgi:DNA-directed RNA polymerase sigma subunit (sigma70/sigma32)